MILRLASILCTMCLLYAATGCGESPKPKPIASGSTDPTASSPTAPAPSLPPEARQKNEAGVKATVEAFVAARNHAGRTGDTTLLKSLVAESCDQCQGVITTINETYSKGGRFVDADWDLNSYRLKGVEDDIAYVEITVNSKPNKHIESAGADPKAYPGSTNFPHFIQLHWAPPGHWIVIALDPKP